tara:strand:- start:20191 stop:21330 length:1140 start_codon:yes stop_codon:yes gene_type:complete
MIRVGTVIKTEDKTSAGVLTIKPDSREGDPVEDVITANMASPNIGAGHGFFSCPGPGSKILYADVNKLGIIGVPFKYLWFAAINTPILQPGGINPTSNDMLDNDASNATQKDWLDRMPEDNPGLLADSGIPEAGNIYADNEEPDQDVWKHSSGHKMVMSHKITSKGRMDNNVLISSAGGKYIKFDDGHPKLHMDNITIEDENENKFQIIAGGERPNMSLLFTKQDQDFISREGQQVMRVETGEGDMVRENQGKGNIEDHCFNGKYVITAEKGIEARSFGGDVGAASDKGDITYTSKVGTVTLDGGGSVELNGGGSVELNGGGRVELRCGASVITMTPGSIDITTPLLTVNGGPTLGGFDLGTHTHLLAGVLPGTTGPAM